MHAVMRAVACADVRADTTNLCVNVRADVGADGGADGPADGCLVRCGALATTACVPTCVLTGMLTGLLTCALARCGALATKALDFLADMFNDEIDSVRIDAIHSMIQIAPMVVYREEQLEVRTQGANLFATNPPPSYYPNPQKRKGVCPLQMAWVLSYWHAGLACATAVLRWCCAC